MSSWLRHTLALLALGLSVPAWANDSELEKNLRAQERAMRFGARATRFQLEELLPQPGETALSPQAPAACKARYAKLFEGSNFDIRVVVGYFNSEDAPHFTMDQAMGAVIAEELQRNCPPAGSKREFLACGFRADGEQLKKSIRGPDGRDRVVSVTITTSSLTILDAVNRKSDSGQAAKTAATRERFVNGLREADALFYLGHSRKGGGPDFAPPIFDRTGHTNYAYYRRERAGLKLLLDSLRTSSSRLQVLGLLSCETGDHFEKSLSRARPGLAWVSSVGLTTVDVQTAGAIGGIEALLSMSCASRLGSRMNPPRVMGSTPTFTLKGFFGR